MQLWQKNCFILVHFKWIKWTCNKTNFLISVRHCRQKGLVKRQVFTCICKVSETWCALYLHQLIWQQLLKVFHWCWFHGRKWPFLATQGKMFVLRRAIESLSLLLRHAPLLLLLRSRFVPTVTDCHSISLFLSHCFSFHLYPPPSLSGPLSAISKTPLKEREKRKTE